MTISNQTYRTSATGSGSVGQEVPFTFPILNTSDLVVKKRTTSTGAEETLTETTDYTVSINGSSGGTVTTVTAIETTEEIHVYRLSPRTQTQSLTQGGTFSASVLMAALDKLTRIVTDLQGQIDLCLKFPRTDDSGLDPELPSSVDRASKYFIFNSAGEPSVSTSVIEGVEVVDIPVSVESLAAGSDISSRIIYTPNVAGVLAGVRLITLGTASGIDDSNTAVLTIADNDGNTVLTKTYNAASQPPAKNIANLSSLIDTDYDDIAIGEYLTLSVTQGATANMPAFVLMLGVRRP